MTNHPETDDPTAAEARRAMREGRWEGMTTYRCPGFVQANLVALPRDWAYEFLLYCQRNPRPCPVLEVTDAGCPEPKRCAPGADLRTDLAQYNVYRDGSLLEQRQDVRDLWGPDTVGFLIGSSLTFDFPLQRAGVELPPKVWVLRTELQTVPAGRLRGTMVVTLRWLRPRDAIIATQLTARFPFNHGAPLHIGDPAQIGADVREPISGEPIDQAPPDRLGVFWACGVTPQQVALESKIPWMITHTSGYGFITDLRADEICLP